MTKGDIILKRKFIITGLAALIIGFLFIHTNAQRSLRFSVLLHGFPKEAFNSDIDCLTQDGDNLTYYQLDPTTTSKQTGPMILWRVHQVGPFYFSSYFGSF